MTDQPPAADNSPDRGATPETKLQIALALLEDANGWAQHFSNVRLALVTFLSGICLGIMSFKWDHPEAFLVWSTLGVWFLGMTLFVIFSMAEWSKLDHRELSLCEIMAAQGRICRRKSAPPHKGMDRITCEWRRQGDWAYAAYFLFTIIFLFAWCEWHERIGESAAKPVTTSAEGDAPEGTAPTTG